MTKRLMILFLMTALLTARMLPAGAEVIPASGAGQIGAEAVVLCQSLTVRESQSTTARAVRTLRAGDRFATQGCSDGWLDCFLSETGGRTGWVKADYVAVDPAWYKTDAATAVRAWNDEGAYQVALLDRGETFPILKTEGEWILIGLRGAAGWIHDAQGAAQARDAAFYPASLAYITRADLTAPDGTSHSLTDPAALSQLSDLMFHSHMSFPSKCPFDAKLTLTLASGGTVTLDMATDSCHAFRTASGVYYEYGDNIPRDPQEDSSAGIGEAFWALFGLKSEDFYK